MTLQLQAIITLPYTLKCLTGLRIGAGDAVYVIGGNDNPVIRDPLTQHPYLPGSSIKGKIRSLLARSIAYGEDTKLPTVDEDTDAILTLFGSANSGNRSGKLSLLQVGDARLTDTSAEQLCKLAGASFMTELKSENSISRLEGKATNPRNVERVPAGATFEGEFRLLVPRAWSEEQLEAALVFFGAGVQLLGLDYLGGHGSRGSGRIRFEFGEAKLQPLEACSLELADIRELWNGSSQVALDAAIHPQARNTFVLA